VADLLHDPAGRRRGRGARHPLGGAPVGAVVERSWGPSV
jgi:hypothetical protein